MDSTHIPDRVHDKPSLGVQDVLRALAWEQSSLLSRANEEREELKKALDRIARYVSSLDGTAGPLFEQPLERVEDEPTSVDNGREEHFCGIVLAVPQTSKPGLPEETVDDVPDPAPADPAPPDPALEVDLDLILETDKLDFRQRRLVTDDTQLSSASTMRPGNIAIDRPAATSPSEASGRRKSGSDGVLEPVMTLIVQQSTAGDNTSEFMKRVKETVDYAGCALVFLNYVVLLVELEMEGRATATLLGIERGDWSQELAMLRALDGIFVFVFLAELLFRISVDRRAFWKDFANWFDTFLVILGLVDIVVNQPFHGATVDSDLVLLKVMRALKSLRALRIVRSFRFLSGLRVLVKACQCFLPSLFWAMILLSIFIFMGAMVMGHSLREYMVDPVQDYNVGPEFAGWVLVRSRWAKCISSPQYVVGLFAKRSAYQHQDRVQMWALYGTAYRSAYTLYEITFAGNWPTNARPVLNKVSQLYSIFFIVYVTIIVFALIRVISAIFLKDTLDAAQNDAEHMVVEKMQKKAVYVRKLEQLFLAIDNTGSGMITEERLTKILTNPKVAALFQTLDLDVHESAALFNLLDDGDGEVTMEEFIDGVMRCKGPARAIDQVAMHAELKQLSRKLGKLLKKVRQSRATSKSHQVFSAASSAIAGAIPRKQHTLSAFLLDSVDAAGLRKNLKAPFP